MNEATAGQKSRRILRQLREELACEAPGQERLDRITRTIAEGMGFDVCSIYLRRDENTLELAASHGLDPAAVHRTRLRIGEGLVGKVALRGRPINTANAPAEPGFRYMPETREEKYLAFLGVPIQRLGATLGVLVVQSREGREYSDDEIYAIEIVAMVLAEMTELGAFLEADDGLGAPHRHPITFRGGSAQEGVAIGRVLLHEPRVVVSNPVAEDPKAEIARLEAALETMQREIDAMLANEDTVIEGEHLKILEAYRMFAQSRSWLERMKADIRSGLSAEAAVEKEQSAIRARMARMTDPYLRERLHDLDDLTNRLLRLLTGQGRQDTDAMPDDPVLVARNIGPAELLDYGKRLRGVVLEEGSVGSHAAIVARALGIPLVIHADGITAEALNGDEIIVDGDQGVVHLRPEENVLAAYRDKLAMQAEALRRYASLRDKPAITRDGVRVRLMMNAGVMVDLPSLESSGAEGVGLFRTELQFLNRTTLPKRSELVELYGRVMDAARGKRIVFRTLDIGSDKVLPYMKREDEPNPALGWRAIRVGLDRPGILRMQLQALIRAARGRPLIVMFPFIAQFEEFQKARQIFLDTLAWEEAHGTRMPKRVEIGAMLETPSLAFAPDQFFQMADFISIGGNDLKQFFFAADRENERVRRRYDTLNVSFLTFIEQIVERCRLNGTPLSFCGEDAGRPVEALAFASMGIRTLSMRATSIGPVKELMRAVSLSEVRQVIDEARRSGAQNTRPALEEWLGAQGLLTRP